MSKNNKMNLDDFHSQKMSEGGKVHAAKNTAKGSTKLLATVILEKGKPASAPAK